MLNASWLEALWLVWTGDPTIRPNEMDEAIVYEEAQSSYGREAQPSDQRCFRKLKTRLDGKPNHTTKEVQKSEEYVSCDKSQGSHGRGTQPYDQRGKGKWRGRELRGISRFVWTGSPTIRPEMDEEKEEERANSGNSESAADKSHQDADTLGPASASVFSIYPRRLGWMLRPSLKYLLI
ncbi:hypothetical protein BKA70DRAFT_1449554 [Coprinopsis sp. MPI-PUGE-AT-0042]|nr:hypothetical protein BKA70DRAFT_1449554 [Coprinopsis sp. MPI-PUGE-AT-0042]